MQTALSENKLPEYWLTSDWEYVTFHTSCQSCAQCGSHMVAFRFTTG